MLRSVHTEHVDVSLLELRAASAKPLVFLGEHRQEKAASCITTAAVVR